MTTLATLTAILVLVPLAGAQRHDAPASLDSERPAVMHDAPGDGSLVAVGRGWKARFAADGASFVPFLGSDAPRDEPVRFELASVRAGDVEIEVSSGTRATRDGDTIRFAREGVEELYQVRAEGLEHVLVFRELPARGEIVVRCRVDTHLVAREVGDAVEFSAGRGGVRYSGAVAFDAAGRRTALPSRWDGESIVLRVPAELTRSAVLPLTIDPLIEVRGLATTPAYELAPDASIVFGPGGLYRCEVWETIWSQTDRDVTARVTRLSNGAVTFHAVDATTEYWSQPKVASIWGSKVQSTFEFVAATGLAASGAREIRGRRLSVYFTPPPSLGPVVTIGTSGGDHHSPDIGGDPFIGGGGSGSHFLVVWERDQPNGDSDILAGGTVGDQAFLLAPLSADPAFDEESPRVSRANGTWLWGVVWERRVSPTDRDVWSSTVQWDFSVVTAPLVISAGPEDDGHPTISSYGPGGFVIAYERDLGGQRDILLQNLGFTTVGAPVDLTLLEGGTHAALDQILPAVDGDGNGYLLSCKESDPVVAGLYRTRLTSFELTVAAQVVTHEAHLPLGGPTTNRTRANVCSEAASTLTSVKKFEVLWDEPVAPSQSEAYAAFYVDGAATGGIVAACFGDGSDTPCPCGNNGGVPAGCPSSVEAHGAELAWTGVARVSADTFVVRATRLPPNGIGLLAQGTLNLSPANSYGDGLLCLGGALARIALRPVSASGELAYPVVGLDPAISITGGVPAGGGARVYQLVYRNLASFCTPATWNTTNALRVNWAP